jgi:hypothetical protein
MWMGVVRWQKWRMGRTIVIEESQNPPMIPWIKPKHGWRIRRNTRQEFRIKKRSSIYAAAGAIAISK